MAKNLLATLTTEQLRRAISLKEQIAALEAQLNQVAGAPAPAAPAAKRPGGRKRSAATRAKMAAAQRARWAKLKPEPSAKPVVKPRFSAAARAKMAAAAKAWWAKRKKAKGGK